LTSPCRFSDDYAPKDRVLNCLDANELLLPLAVCPEGKQLVAAGFRKLAWVTDWDDRGRCAASVQEPDFGERVDAAAFCGDGRRVAVYARSPAQDTLAVLDPRTRQVLKKWPAPRSIYTPELRLSHDGTVLAMNPVERAGRSEHLEAVTLWDTSTGQLLGSVPTPQGLYLTDFVLCRGRVLLAYHRLPDYKEIRIFESPAPYAQARPVSSIAAPGATIIYGARFSADGVRLAVASHHAQPLTVYAVSDGHLIAEFEKPHYGVRTAVFPGFALSPSGRFAAVSNTGGTITLWSVGSARELCTLEGRRYDGVHELVFGPNDTTLISRDSHAVVVWDIHDLVARNR
jgi:WD40 repeat protein